MRLEPRPAVVDVSILAGVVAALATGLLSLVSGRPGDWPVFAAHGVAGVVLVALLFFKFRRVAPRVRDPSRWERATAVSLLTALTAVGALATGVYWTLGGNFRVLAWNAMNVHVLFGLVLVLPLLAHLASRFRLPTRADVEGRRTALQTLALLGGGALAWRLGQAATVALDVAGSERFTGSKQEGEEPGNTFPVTIWVADDPDPLDPEAWSLRVGGAVERGLDLGYDELPTADDRRAVLDCTSGWYTDQEWSGVRVGRLLDAAGAAPEAEWVSFRSVTGYRWSLPVDEARDALLATGVGGERLTHGHGFPLRLVAPGRRGFQWVKWVDAVEVRTEPDYGQWVAIFASGFG